MLRKISRKQSFSYEHNGQNYKINSNQVLLGMILYPSEWMKMDLITIGKNEKVKNIFPLNKEYLSYWDFWKPCLKINFPPTSFNSLDTTITVPPNKDLIFHTFNSLISDNLGANIAINGFTLFNTKKILWE